MRRCLLVAAAAGLLLGAGLVLDTVHGCAGELPEGNPDRPRSKDMYVWPDTSPDLFPSSSDTYQGAAFGCQTDDECFGQLCCRTPWGVKICTATCSTAVP